MNKSTLASFTLACLLTSCAIAPPAKPYRHDVSEIIEKSELATVWAGNALKTYMMIVSVDGQMLPVQEEGGRPYSVMLRPGKHRLGVSVQSLTDLPMLQGQRFGSIDLEIDALTAHDYALWFEKVDSDGNFQVSIEDLGTERSCRYVVIGRTYQGYVPVYLNCPQAK